MYCYTEEIERKGRSSCSSVHPSAKQSRGQTKPKGHLTLACRFPLACPCHGFYTECTIMRCSSGPVSTSGECALRPAETVSVSQDKAHELFVHHTQHRERLRGERRPNPTGNPNPPGEAISADLDAISS